jgi:hypothetical protein
MASKDRIFWFLFGLSIILFFVSIKYRKQTPFFFVVSYPLLIWIAAYLYSLNLFSLKRNIPFSLFSGFAFIFLATSFAIKIFSAQPDPFMGNFYYYPYKAVQFLKENEDIGSLKMLNYFAWGGYLDWVWPEKKIFIDGKNPQIPLENGKTFVEEYSRFYNKEEMESQFGKYDIKMVFWPVKEPNYLSKWDKLAINFFLTSKIKNEYLGDKGPLNYLEKNWIKVYSDEVSVIYIEPSANNASHSGNKL